MKIAVGSKNPVKIKASKIAFSKAFPDKKIEVIGVNVSSGVSEMPLSFKEMVKGAQNRAEKALEAEGADFGVGIEGGLEEEEIGVFLSGFVALLSKEGVWSYAQGAGIRIPNHFVKRVKEEKIDLGTIIDELKGEEDTKKKKGCVGLFTNNLIPRTDAFVHTLTYALSRYLHPDFFK